MKFFLTFTHYLLLFENFANPSVYTTPSFTFFILQGAELFLVQSFKTGTPALFSKFAAKICCKIRYAVNKLIKLTEF